MGMGMAEREKKREEKKRERREKKKKRECYLMFALLLTAMNP